MPEGEATFSVILQLVQTGGVVAVLLYLVFSFMSGKIVPATVVEKLLSEAENRTLKMAEELRNSIKEAVKQGYLEAREELLNKRMSGDR